MRGTAVVAPPFPSHPSESTLLLDFMTAHRGWAKYFAKPPRVHVDLLILFPFVKFYSCSLRSCEVIYIHTSRSKFKKNIRKRKKK